MKRLEFYFDFQSPYSYLCFNWLSKNIFLLEKLDIKLDYKPVFLGSIIKHYETKGPAEIKSKRNYLFKNCLRYAKENNIDFTVPKSLPFNSLYSLRIIEGVIDEEKLKFIDLIFSAGWAKGLEIGDEESLKEILLNAGENQDVLDHCSSKEVRIRMKKNLKEAIAKGVFGVPTFIVDEELFWGNDSIMHLEKYLKGNDDLEMDKYRYFTDNYFVYKV